MIKNNNLEITFKSPNPDLEIEKNKNENSDYLMNVVPNISFKINIKNKSKYHKIISVFIDGVNIFDRTISLDEYLNNPDKNKFINGYGIIKPTDEVVVDGYKNDDGYNSFIINDDPKNSEAVYITGEDNKHLGYIDIFSRTGNVVKQNNSSSKDFTLSAMTVKLGNEIDLMDYNRMSLLSNFKNKPDLNLDPHERVRISLRLKTWKNIGDIF